MKSLFAIAVLALTLTTGFTCSKNTPEATKNEAPTQPATGAMEATQPQPSQEQMAQPTNEPTPPAADGSTAATTPEPESK